MIALSRIKMDNNKHEMTTVTLNVKGWVDKAVASKTHLFHTITSRRGVIPINMCKFVCE